MREYVEQYRTSTTPFDIVRFADVPECTPEEVRARIQPWAGAGVTWWIMGALARKGAFEVLQRRILEGLPQGVG